MTTISAPGKWQGLRMRIVTRIIALTRSIQLNRQFREIEKAISELPLATRRQLAAIAMREFASAAKCEFPHLYGTVNQGQRYQPWGNGTDIGYARMKADNQHLQLRGIALWLTVAYHETKESAYGDMQQLHRHLMRTLRLLKESMPATPADSLWATPQKGQAAA
ncbi:MAG: hypothetical protein KGH92_04750 [Xanthomonadaceae bacterium]|nr:hypothetical protein [Xanthomonadaceae bacterium]